MHFLHLFTYDHFFKSLICLDSAYACRIFHVSFTEGGGGRVIWAFLWSTHYSKVLFHYPSKLQWNMKEAQISTHEKSILNIFESFGISLPVNLLRTLWRTFRVMRSFRAADNGLYLCRMCCSRDDWAAAKRSVNTHISCCYNADKTAKQLKANQ